MGSSELKGWVFVQSLEKLVESPTDPDGSTPAYKKVLHATALRGEPATPMPSAACKKLVLEVKAPKAVAVLCVLALQQHPRSATLRAAVFVLDALVTVLGRLDVFEGAHKSRLAASVLQQLEQAGLVQHMPALLADATQQLAACIAALTASAATLSLSSSTSNARGAPSLSRQARGAAWEAVQAMMHARGTLPTLLTLFNLAPAGFEAACAVAAVQLVLLLFATADRLLLLLPQPQQLCNDPQLIQNGPGPVAQALDAAYAFLLGLSRFLTDAALSGRHSAQLLPQIARCMAIMVCVTLMAQQGADAASGSSSSSRQRTASARSPTTSSASSSGGSRPRAHAAAAAAQGRGSGAATPASSASGFSFPVSPLTGRLFELLGVSQATVMQAAAGCKASAGGTDPHRIFARTQMFVGLYMELSKAWEQLPVRLRRRVGDSDITPSISSSELLVQAEVALLLSLLLLQWADSLPSGHSDREEAFFTATAVSLSLCNGGLIRLKTDGGSAGVQMLATPAVPQSMLPATGVSASTQQHSAGQQPATSPDQQQHSSGVPALGQPQQSQAQQQQQQQQPVVSSRPLPSTIVAELLPLVVELCTSRLQLLLGQSSGPLSPPPAPTPASQTLCQESSTHRSRETERVESVLQHLGTLLMLLVNWCLAGEGHGAAPAEACSCLQETLKRLVAYAEDAIVLEAVVRTWLRYELEGGSREPRAAWLESPESSRLDKGQQFSYSVVLLATLAGPHSAAQRQCYSFLSSLQKNGMIQAGSHASLHTRLHFVDLAAILLNDKAQQQQQQKWHHLRQEAPSPLVASAAASLSLLPSLVIIGRCFLKVATVLQPAVAPDGLAEQQQQHVLALVSCSQQLGRFAGTAQKWLQAHSQSLAAAGYGPDTVLQQLEQLLAALEAMVQSSSSAGSTSQDLPAAVMQQLQLAGADLTSLPVPCLCNNPGCTNAAGLSELGLVSGRSCVCGGCRVAHYCGRSCQRSHWKQHKPVCAALAAAASAEAATAAAPLDAV